MRRPPVYKCVQKMGTTADGLPDETLLAGLGAGTLIGRAMYPNDSGTRGIVMVFLAPAFAVLGAVIFMELFKPGEEVEGPYATISVARAQLPMRPTNSCAR